MSVDRELTQENCTYSQGGPAAQMAPGFQGFQGFPRNKPAHSRDASMGSVVVMEATGGGRSASPVAVATPQR